MSTNTISKFHIAEEAENRDMNIQLQETTIHHKMVKGYFIYWSCKGNILIFT